MAIWGAQLVEVLSINKKSIQLRSGRNMVCLLSRQMLSSEREPVAM